jgi:hypothetical protein
MRDQSDRAEPRLLRPAVLLLVVAIHAALLLIAPRSAIRMAMRSEEPLILLAPPEHAQVPGPAASAAALPRKKLLAPRDTQLVTVPPAARQPPPADAPAAPAAPIDWNSEAELAIKQQAQLAMATPPRGLDKHRPGADLNGGLGPDRRQKSEFGWDRTHTRRIEPIEGGGLLIRLSDNCVLVLIPLPLVGCGIGKKPVRGDLFDHMRDAPPLDGSAKNTAP